MHANEDCVPTELVLLHFRCPHNKGPYGDHQSGPLSISKLSFVLPSRFTSNPQLATGKSFEFTSATTTHAPTVTRVAEEPTKRTSRRRFLYRLFPFNDVRWGEGRKSNHPKLVHLRHGTRRLKSLRFRVPRRIIYPICFLNRLNWTTYTRCAIAILSDLAAAVIVLVHR